MSKRVKHCRVVENMQRKIVKKTIMNINSIVRKFKFESKRIIVFSKILSDFLSGVSYKVKNEERKKIKEIMVMIKRKTII